MGKKMETHEDAVKRAKEAEEIAKQRLAELAEAEESRAEIHIVPEPEPPSQS